MTKRQLASGSALTEGRAHSGRFVLMTDLTKGEVLVIDRSCILW